MMKISQKDILDALLEETGLSEYIIPRVDIVCRCSISFIVKKIPGINIILRLKVFWFFLTIEKSRPAGIVIFRHNTKEIKL